MCNCDKFGLWPNRVNHRLRVQIALGIHLHPFQHHALAFAQEMPRHNIGVMLHDRQHDLIAGLQPRRGPAIGHKVDPLCRTRGEDDLFFRPSLQEPRDGAAHGLILVGGKVRKVVQAPVNIGIFHRIGLRHSVNHNARLLRRCPVVEVDERLAVHRAGQDRKIAPDLCDVIHSGALRSGSRKERPHQAPPENSQRECQKTPPHLNGTRATRR